MINFYRTFGQNQPFIYLSLLLLAVFILFLTFWLKEPRSLLNGILFTFFLIMLGIWLTVIVQSTQIPALTLLYEILLVFLLGIINLVVIFSWLFFLANAYVVWRHESHTLSNLLTLFIGLIIILAWGIILLDPFSNLPAWIKTLTYAPAAIIVYLLFVAYNFLVNLVLYQFVPRQYKQDYLIVLGAGLANGETVTPLLAGRINRAIEFAQKQVLKGQAMPKLIMSGGRGNDEKVPEAQAMAEYALARGIDPAYILLETKSKNTYQNMQFSEQIAALDFGSKNFHAKFFSNNYHILRAALHAKATGLNANGVGSYTRLYFLPNAIVREFAGVLLISKRRHLLVILAIILFYAIYAVMQLIGIRL